MKKLGLLFLMFFSLFSSKKNEKKVKSTQSDFEKAWKVVVDNMNITPSEKFSDSLGITEERREELFKKLAENSSQKFSEDLKLAATECKNLNEFAFISFQFGRMVETQDSAISGIFETLFSGMPRRSPGRMIPPGLF